MAAISRPAGAKVMGEYRAYLLKDDGHVIHRHDLVCPDDSAARRIVLRGAEGICTFLHRPPPNVSVTLVQRSAAPLHAVPEIKQQV